MLEFFPEKTGNWLYHSLQNVFQPFDIENMNKSHLGTLTRFEKRMNQFGRSFKGKSVLEVGSGWLPLTPYNLLSVFEVDCVFTYDIKKHFSSKNIMEVNKYFNAYGNLTFPTDDSLHGRVYYRPNTDICEEPPAIPVQVMISRNVLEHIDPLTIRKIHLSAHKFILKNGLIIHQISPSDHRAYTDKSITLWDFLRYSQDEWDRVQTRFDYHNRLRLPQYIEIFEKSGWQILHCEHDGTEDSVELPDLHSDYSKFTTKELTAGNILIILKRMSD